MSPATLNPGRPLPAYAKAGMPGTSRLNVIDAETGEPIERVVEANAAEGWLIRHEVDAGGCPIRNADLSGVVTVKEKRPFRFEWGK